MWNRRGEEEMAYGDVNAMGLEPDSDGLPSYVDPTGVQWRQHPDGAVDWFDQVSGQWVPYSEV